jgi:hypothetical protein
MAHPLHKFHELRANHRTALPKEALDLFGALYVVKRLASKPDGGDRQRLRELRSKPITDTLNERLTLLRQRALDGTAIARAIDYSLGRRKALTRFLKDGALPIDKNWVENRIRPIATTQELAVCRLRRRWGARSRDLQPLGQRQTQRSRPGALPASCARTYRRAPDHAVR